MNIKDIERIEREASLKFGLTQAEFAEKYIIPPSSTPPIPLDGRIDTSWCKALRLVESTRMPDAYDEYLWYENKKYGYGHCPWCRSPRNVDKFHPGNCAQCGGPLDR